jgi:hypothetical protein
MAGIIGLLKPGRCLPPWNKSFCLDVGATARPEEDCKNKKTSHGGNSPDFEVREISLRRLPNPFIPLRVSDYLEAAEQISTFEGRKSWLVEGCAAFVGS